MARPHIITMMPWKEYKEQQKGVAKLIFGLGMTLATVFLIFYLADVFRVIESLFFNPIIWLIVAFVILVLWLLFLNWFDRWFNRWSRQKHKRSKHHKHKKSKRHHKKHRHHSKHKHRK